MSKKRLIITIDESSGQYVIDTPDGGINYEMLGLVISEFLLKFFHPNYPPEIDENGVINMNASVGNITEYDEDEEYEEDEEDTDEESVTPSKKTYTN